MKEQKKKIKQWRWATDRLHDSLRQLVGADDKRMATSSSQQSNSCRLPWLTTHLRSLYQFLFNAFFEYLFWGTFTEVRLRV